MAIYIDALFALQATIPPQRCGGMRGEAIGVGKSNEMHDLLGDKRSQTKCTICLGIRELSPRASSPFGGVARSHARAARERRRFFPPLLAASSLARAFSRGLESLVAG